MSKTLLYNNLPANPGDIFLMYESEEMSIHWYAMKIDNLPNISVYFFHYNELLQ